MIGIILLLFLPFHSLDCTESSEILLWEFKACERCIPSYLLGTAHVPSKLVWDRLSPKVMQALERTRVFVGEIDAQSASVDCLKQPDHSLKTLITDDTKAAVIQTLSTLGIPQPQRLYDQMEEFQWRIALSQLSSAILMIQTGAEQSDPIFDLKLQQYMREKSDELVKEHGTDRAKIRITGIEKTTEQCKFFDSDTKDPEIVNAEAMLFTKTVAKDVESTLNMYLCHPDQLSLNLDFFTDDQLSSSDLDEAQIKKIKAADKKLTDALLWKRNAVMADRIVSQVMERQRRVHMFAFGAAHFLSANSVLDHLRKKGVSVVQVTAEDSIPTDTLVVEYHENKKGDPLIVKMLYYIFIFIALFGASLVFRVILTTKSQHQYEPVRQREAIIETESDEELETGHGITPGRKGI